MALIEENVSSEIFSPPRRFPGMRFQVSKFFLIAMLGLSGALALVSYKQGLFTQQTSLFFYTPDAIGISKGLPIRLFGLQVGVVQELHISDKGVKVEISITTDHVRRIPKHSKIRLVREGFIGGASLQIIPDSKSKISEIMVTQGDELEFVLSMTIVDIVEELKGKVTPLISDARLMLEEFNSPQGDYRRSIAAASEFLRQLPATNQEARKLLRSTDRAVSSAEGVLETAVRISGQVEQQLPGITIKLSSTLDSFEQTADQLREATRMNGNALHETLTQGPALVRDAAGLIQDANQLINDGRNMVSTVRQVWPLRNLADVKTAHTLAIDSFEAREPAQANPTKLGTSE